MLRNENGAPIGTPRKFESTDFARCARARKNGYEGWGEEKRREEKRREEKRREEKNPAPALRPRIPEQPRTQLSPHR